MIGGCEMEVGARALETLATEAARFFTASAASECAVVSSAPRWIRRTTAPYMCWRSSERASSAKEHSFGSQPDSTISISFARTLDGIPWSRSVRLPGCARARPNGRLGSRNPSEPAFRCPRRPVEDLVERSSGPRGALLVRRRRHALPPFRRLHSPYRPSSSPCQYGLSRRPGRRECRRQRRGSRR